MSNNQSSAVAEILAADRAFANLCLEKGPTVAFQAYLAEEALIFRQAIAVPMSPNDAVALYAVFPDTLRMTWASEECFAASSGDLGYVWGYYTIEGTLLDDVPVAQQGRYVSIWRRQEDGNWKAVLDIGNADNSAQPEA